MQPAKTRTSYKSGLTSVVALAMILGAQSISLPVAAQTPTLPIAIPGAGGAINPQTLITGNIGQNVITALQGGADPGQLASALAQSGVPGIGGTGINAMSPQQLTGMLGTIGTQLTGGTMNPAAAANLVAGAVAGAVPPQISTALAAITNFGNLAGNAQGIASIFTPATIAGLNNLPAGQQGFAIDQLIRNGIAGGLGGVNQAGVQQLAAVVGQMPAVVAAIQQGGVQNVLTAVSGLLAGATGGNNPFTALLGGLAGIPGVGGTAGTAGSGTGRTKDKGDYEITNKVDPAPNKGPAAFNCPNCQSQARQIKSDHIDMRKHVHEQFIQHRSWIVNVFWKENVLPAMMLMAEQLTAVGIQQVEIIGTMLDAKHQLETQRLMQQMSAEAHKDYHPSEGMCTFGTTVRNLASSDRKSDFTHVVMAERMMKRQIMSGDSSISSEGPETDIYSRMHRFIETYCDRADNRNGLETLCESTTTPAARKNIDIDYTRNIESRLTLDLDPIAEAGTGSQDTADKEDVMALGANLFAHNTAPIIEPEKLGKSDGRVLVSGAQKYLELRGIYAKRSVAQNSFAALTAMRASGMGTTDSTGAETDSAAPYIKALIRELGVSNPDDINKLLGENPSYFAQMEVLTKKIYQNPTFYTELYDKPVNIGRKGAAIQAISLMQDRDLYNSLLRSEAVLSVLLETMLVKEQERIVSSGAPLSPEVE